MPDSIGVLLPTPRDEPFLRAMQAELREVFGRGPPDLIFHVRSATEGEPDQMRGLIAELLHFAPTLLVTASSPAALAMAEATATTPIVFINVFDPVILGLVHAIDRPGTNCTGIAGVPPDIAGRWVAMLKALVPALSRIGLLFHPGTAAAMMPSHREAAARAAAELGIEVFELPLPDLASLDSVLTPIADQSHPGQPGTGLVVIPSNFMPAHRDVVVPAINRHRIPALYGVGPMMEAGGLASFAPDMAAQWRLAATHVDALLRGAEIRTLPVRVAPKIVLTLNLATAALLGLEIPARLRYQAEIVT